jgi:23S rRNA (uridine2552-2'-O)-methyltransferase
VARSKSSARWLKEHFSDPYVKRAQAEGWRSRAAPGGWSQMVAREGCARTASRPGDRAGYPADAGIAGVEARGHFARNWLQRLKPCWALVDLVLSDMAPNISGVGIGRSGARCTWPNWHRSPAHGI